MNKIKLLLPLLALGLALSANAENAVIDNVQVSAVAVNGVNDTANPGTTCIKLSAPVMSQCAAGFIAIRNNNADLVRAALVAKSSKSKVWAYYNVETVDVGHCPGLVFTKCSLISLMLKD